MSDKQGSFVSSILGSIGGTLSAAGVFTLFALPIVMIAVYVMCFPGDQHLRHTGALAHWSERLEVGGMRVVARVRIAGPGFSRVTCASDFVLVELWTQWSPEPIWKAETKDIVMLSDNVTLIATTKPQKRTYRCADPQRWIEPIARYHTLFELEECLGFSRQTERVEKHWSTDDGRHKLTLVMASAMGVPSIKDASAPIGALLDRRTMREYTIDVGTGRTEAIRVYATVGAERVLLFETLTIDYAVTPLDFVEIESELAKLQSTPIPWGEDPAA
jgi:hypothetical protein